jgi:hypothetical protein
MGNASQPDEGDSPPVYWVGLDGDGEGDGSYDSPWPSIGHALEQVGGGNTIIVKRGIYRGPIRIPCKHGGEEGRPTTIRSEVKWQAIIVGSEGHGICSADDDDWVVVDGFQVMGARSNGICIGGDDSVVRNCWVHHNKSMGISMHGGDRGVIERNLIEYNGTSAQWEHGVYADGDGLIVRGNVVRHNAGFGLQLYPRLTNSLVANNLVHGTPQKQKGIVVARPEGGGSNVIVNNTVHNGNGCLSLWNGEGTVVANNIFVSDGADPIEFWASDSQENLSPDDGAEVLLDYNLCLPKSNLQGPHGLTGDPRFAAPEKGVYWLGAGSPAIGAGAPAHAPDADFWGNDLPTDSPPDLGAFRFLPILTSEDSRESWHGGYAYAYGGAPTTPMSPDLWWLPADAQ